LDKKSRQTLLDQESRWTNSGQRSR